MHIFLNRSHPLFCFLPFEVFFLTSALQFFHCTSQPICPCHGEPLITRGFIYSASTAGWTATSPTNRSARCYRQRKEKKSLQSPWYSSGNGREVARKQRGSTQSSSLSGMLLQVITEPLTLRRFTHFLLNASREFKTTPPAPRCDLIWAGSQLSFE